MYIKGSIHALVRSGGRESRSKRRRTQELVWDIPKILLGLDRRLCLLHLEHEQAQLLDLVRGLQRPGAQNARRLLEELLAVRVRFGCLLYSDSPLSSSPT